MSQDTSPLPSSETDIPVFASKAERKQRVNDNKLSKRIMREVGRAIGDFNMIEEGDKVMVCLSGGKDSYGLLDVLMTLQKRAPIKFDIVAVNLDQKQPGFPDHILPEYLEKLGVPYHIETQDTYSVVTRVIAEGKTMCSLCSRLRRGILYRVAKELGATKIALGHHRDDILATFFLNLFYGGRMKGMPPKLMSDNGEHIVIRPLAYVPEKDLIAYAKLKEFPIIPCNLCGSQENLKRQEINRMIADWDKKFPHRSWNVFGALTRVVPSHLMDPKLHNFADLKVTGQADPEGDKGFDQDYFDDHLPESLLAAGFEEDADDAAPTVRQDAFTPAKPAASGEQQIVFMSKRRSGQ
ncbi:tRNA 2-thiocytidine(32) synthetase TtcA [Alcaligenes ammonioxydans]|uniref:tRNA-cytidine(32) 2-sulfurtransferase n=1 Tax=Alcaligenes ammonioxydans TaxID=2582914 RepID=A0ABX8T2E4_9BURK|nr:tRNA 2-thiocytidine(32) synthetase TtcA [Alcaligenes ammonioxydans]EJC61332.1 tRNA 2-thiocytidine biosynthesis protein TtcA [Alcaligenes faecalis subsp. faecalis NCIB 8687]QBH19172.1 tRNA 2-thiocytidine(32) synthetase TtcA [Alcaligenes faecalis]MCH1881018.1 tRNA 2-thiocytidine(32) synthetase TtcA [Alcaligenes ammonioxydans]QXX80274.1 tRNA 2-thiocytidine(32) synthetase TtcA [Alcaligenes ammonioxydans]WGQ35253.1 tRNA 2-thiocytidine(32) synthetase TtcA [Alcaligenes faecalis]